MVPQASKKCGLLLLRSSTNRLLHEQRHQLGTGSWHLLRAHDLIALSTGIGTKREKVPDTIFMPTFSMLSSSAYARTGRGIWEQKRLAS